MAGQAAHGQQCLHLGGPPSGHGQWLLSLSRYVSRSLSLCLFRSLRVSLCLSLCVCVCACLSLSTVVNTQAVRSPRCLHLGVTVSATGHGQWPLFLHGCAHRWPVSAVSCQTKGTRHVQSVLRGDAGWKRKHVCHTLCPL